MPYLFIAIGIIVLIALYFISVQRQFVTMEERTSNALAQIGVQQTSRWDALTQLAKATKSYSTKEHDTLMDVIAARRGGMPQNAAEANQQEQLLQQTTAQLFAVAESYPELKSSDLYSKTMDSINSYEDLVRKSRMVYNDTITRWNRMVRVFPQNLIANMMGYTPKEYLETDESKADMPNLEF